MIEWEIDLFSDTKTRPSAGMREAMSRAVVGDEQQDEDPTVAALNSRVAAMLGKEAGIFLPSGTMANLISTMVHCARGDEILCEASSHLLHFETGGPAAIAGALPTPLPGSRGMFSAQALDAAIRSPRRNGPRSRLVWIEQTTNLGGGAIWPLDALKDIRRLADARGLAVHIDGARLLNAAIGGGLDPIEYGTIGDSLWIDFTKGLGAPFGAVLVGSAEFVDAARRLKDMLGGAMRQGGIMAAACLYALDHNVERLSKDHEMAKEMANILKRMDGLQIEGPVETNIIIVDVTESGRGAAWFADRLSDFNIRVGVFSPNTVRLVTHLDLPQDTVSRLNNAIKNIMTNK